MKLDVHLKKQLGQFNLTANFSVCGKRIGIFGPSGSGKSTLSSLIAGLTTPESGTICLNDRYLFCQKRGVHVAPEKRRIAVVFQHAHLFPHLSVKRNLLYGFKRLPAAQRKINFETLVKALDIEPLLGLGVTKLSGGEKQRVALGRALLTCPDLLIFDEPLSALDPKLKGQIIPYLRKVLRRFEIPYLFISHSLEEMRLLTDQVIHFSCGMIQEITNAETLAREHMLEDHHEYLNHLQLSEPREVGSMLGYRWGHNELLLTDHKEPRDGLFELSSKEILLFKNHPHALSARNLLKARISELIPMGGMVGVRLDCHGEELFAQVVREAALELNLKEGIDVYAATKASAFKRLIG